MVTTFDLVNEVLGDLFSINNIEDSTFALYVSDDTMARVKHVSWGNYLVGIVRINEDGERETECSRAFTYDAAIDEFRRLLKHAGISERKT
jgi:hypothetical protein